MALQAKQLIELLRSDNNAVSFFPANLPFPRGLRFLNRLPGVRTLCRAALIWPSLWRAIRDVQVIHVLAASWIYFFSIVCPAVILGKLRHKRVVLNYRGGEAQRFFRRWGWLIAPVFRKADEVTTPSRFLATVIEGRFGIPVRIVPNVIDGALFRFRDRPLIEPKFLVARNLESMYGVDLVLKAFGLIQERYPNASLSIAGSGSREQDLRSLASALNLRNVRFLGQVRHHCLPEVFDACDVLLNASWVDNFPSTLLEGSAAGLVVVSTATGGIPFMYRNGEDALLVDPGDWRALARAAERVLESPSVANRLLRSGCELAESCQWDRVRNVLYAAYGTDANRSEDDAQPLTADARL
jgi:glycosyltransferase involved in cell wall biosynthesis